jgi:prepilin-type N-terminal cleavage/methylation domain-containing protein
MVRREQGFTLIEILVVITIIAALVGMVTLIIPKGEKAREQLECMNNLKQIGDSLKLLDVGGKLKNYLGAAFVLQVASDVNDADLGVFVCPGEPENYDDPRPAVGSDEFKAMYRKEMELPTKIEERFTSYAGPNWRDFPPRKAGTGATEERLWACDKCRNGGAHHDGVVVLHESTKTEFIDFKDLKGMGTEGEIIVGKNSPDPRLEKMIFWPNQ